jgi:Ku protein
MENENLTRNKYCFGLGTVGRDMLYTLVSMYLLFYLTDILNLPDSTMWWMTAVLTVLRVFDAVNDPFMGVLVDNTKSRYGKFKPWIAVGAVLAGVFTVLMFTDTGMTGSSYIVFFTFVYLTWDIVYGANDIAYWSMLPSLTIDLREREKIGSFAKICANVGMYIVVVAIIPVTEILSRLTGSAVQGWFVFSLIVAGLLLLFQSFTVFGVKEMKGTFKEEEKTTLREMFSVIFKNDQLMVTAVAMALFVLVTDEDFSALENEKKEKSIEILDFVQLSEIDPIYFDKTYYLSPRETGGKAYKLLRKAMSDTGKIAIAKIVIRNKESLAALRVYKDVLVLETIFYPDEVREISLVPDVPSDQEVVDKELDMAKKLIENLTETFDPKKYVNTYREDLLDLIRKKVEGQEIQTAPSAVQSNVVDIMEALQASLKETQKKTKKKRSTG